MSAPASPTLVKRKANFAERVITRKSAARASTDPAPAAVPWIAAITGTGDSRIARTTSPVIRVNDSSSSGRIWQGRADDLVDVAPGAEGPALSAQDDHAGVLAVRDLGEEVAQVGVRLEGQGVELVGTVERDRGDAAVAVTSKCFQSSVNGTDPRNGLMRSPYRARAHMTCV